MSHDHTTFRPRLAAGFVVATLLLGATACSSPETVPAADEETNSAESASPPVASGEKLVVHRDGYNVVSYVTAGTTGTIVLDAGGGNDASYWNELAPQLAASTSATIVTYDRTGVGQSDEVPGAFSPAAAGDDLAAVIESIDRPEGPVVLVGHSIAGEVAHALVSSHSQLIDGAVLIDANLPPFFTPEQTARLVEENRDAVEELKAAPSTRQIRQFIAAAENWGPVHNKFYTATWPSDLPVAVIVSEQTPFTENAEDAQNWRDAAELFASEADNRSLLTAKNTSHDVPLDDPELVERAIAEMFASF